ncbi:energy transducer TonB [Microbulbifer marinus]|uniref:energy transducer TonB n=1 Tax=Microbulbifer marinus TaxID=658218 RepID=UPI000B85C627|nr:TonB family protein [Microbulbifer marinus]
MNKIIVMLGILLIFISGNFSATRVFGGLNYPIDALEKCIEGWVDLEFSITEQGEITNIVVVDSKPHGIFEDSAKSALLKASKQVQDTYNVDPKSKKLQHRISYVIDWECVPHDKAGHPGLRPSAGRYV